MFTYQELIRLPFAQRHYELIHNQGYWIDLIETGRISQEEALQFIYLNICKHPETEIVFYVDAAGRKRYKHECLICGYGGNDISVKLWKLVDIEKIPPRRHETYRILSEEIRDIYRPVIMGARHDDFMAYYSTLEWYRRRDIALQRDKFTCQICGNTAVEVHHLTYAHFKNEYLFELVSLCSQCHHDYYHPEK